MMDKVDEAYRRYCRERFPLPCEKDIDELEERIKVRFPADYRSFLLEYNGGFFARPLIESPGDPCPTDQLRAMNGIRATHEIAELGRSRDLSLFTENDPPEVVPIGYTGMNYLILLVVAQDGEDYGHVLLRTFDESFYLAATMEEYFGLFHGPCVAE